MRKSIFVALAVILGIVAALPAQAASVAPEAAKRYMTDLGNRAMDSIAKQPDAATRNRQFIALMLDNLDFDALGTFALGKLARAATPEEKRVYKPLFAAYVIDVAVARFGDLKLQSFGLGSVTPQPNGDAKVYTRLTTDGTPMEVYWRLHDEAGRISINDIEVAGYSLGTHYRGEFERAGVSTVPGLINKLQGLTQQSVALPTVRSTFK